MVEVFTFFNGDSSRARSRNNMTIFFTRSESNGNILETSFVTFQTYYRSTDGFYLRLNLHQFACIYVYMFLDSVLHSFNGNNMLDARMAFASCLYSYACADSNTDINLLEAFSSFKTNWSSN